LKIQVIFYMFFADKDWFCSILSPYFYLVTKAVRTVYAYMDHILVIFLDCMCRLQYVNYFICSPHNILLFKYISKIYIKINMNLEACCFKSLIKKRFIMFVSVELRFLKEIYITKQSQLVVSIPFIMIGNRTHIIMQISDRYSLFTD
jgi:hypothetical protein